MKKLTVFAIVISLAACTTRLITPTEADAERGRRTYPNLTLAELNEGKALYEEHCDACHKLKKLSSEPVEEWKKIIPEMAVKAKITKEAEEKITKYVITMHEVKR